MFKILLIFLGVAGSLFGVPQGAKVTSACNFGFEGRHNFIKLSTKGTGWLEVANKTHNGQILTDIVLVNRKKPEARYVLGQDSINRRRSFNFRGDQEIACFVPTNKKREYKSGEPLQQVNCTDVVDVTKCEEQSTELRYNDLHLMN